MRRLFRKRYTDTVEPDEVFLDTYNLPAFNRYQLEGHMGAPLSSRGPLFLGLLFLVVAGIYCSRLMYLQIAQGAYFADQSKRNHLAHEVVFAERGVIYDRRGELLVWNESRDAPFSGRASTHMAGMAHVLGYVRFPRRDAQGVYHRTRVEGVSGVELAFDEYLRGENGLAIIETDARGRTVSRHAIKVPSDGDSLTLTIDARLQDVLYRLLETRSRESGFQSGAAVILDVHTGDTIALVSYPEFDTSVMAEGTDVGAIRALREDSRNVFLHRALSGLYTPGSVVKPIIALAALSEGIIDPETRILSTGALVVPNPYTPNRPSIFRDWRAHGLVDMRRALAVSSNVYFFHIGGGYGEQEGLGISRIEHYARQFGLAEETGIELQGDVRGVIPSPSWKMQTFGESTWRVGDTYNTAIGQYGFQVTPLQVARATAAIASGGVLVRPRVALTTPITRVQLPVLADDVRVVAEGMRAAVLEGTAQALNVPWVSVAAKTGTAEVGARKEYINSWVVGFFPFEDPKYAFAVLLERAPAGTLTGAPFVMHEFFRHLRDHISEYLPEKNE